MTSSPVFAADAVSLGALQGFGDFRLRMENNTGDQDRADQDRLTLRTRLGARYPVAPGVTLGGRGILHQSSEPDGLSGTLESLVDSRRFVLDQAYARFERGAFALTAGRFTNPFVKTELQLLWDNDVSPQGLAARYDLGASGGHVAALYYPIEVGAVGRNSSMSGAQWALSRGSATLSYNIALGYYDYSLSGRPNPDSDAFRGNLLADDGSYLSDFNLVDVIGSVICQPFGPAWPVEVVGNYTNNTGAETSADTAFAADLYLGRNRHAGDWRFNYAFSLAQTDAVFAAFSQDNTRIATNYRQHSFGVEYVPKDHVVLSASWYHYRPESTRDAQGNEPNDWLDRVRLNVVVDFSFDGH